MILWTTLINPFQPLEGVASRVALSCDRRWLISSHLTRVVAEPVPGSATYSMQPTVSVPGKSGKSNTTYAAESSQPSTSHRCMAPTYRLRKVEFAFTTPTRPLDWARRQISVSAGVTAEQPSAVVVPW